ncbi:MAG: hypothetical protein QM775_18180 [Pirellulales bacterium]
MRIVRDADEPAENSETDAMTASCRYVEPADLVGSIATETQRRASLV